jgi:hypothetical protein
MLTTATLVPMDAQHLPIKTVKAIKSDAALLLEVEVPKTAEIPGMKKTPVTTTAGSDKQGDADDLDDDDTPQQRRGEAASDDENSDKKSVFFEYDLATTKLTLLPDFQDPKKPRWASVSPDDSTIVFAHGHNLFTMDAANYAKARHLAMRNCRNADHHRRRAAFRIRPAAAGRGQARCGRTRGDSTMAQRAPPFRCLGPYLNTLPSSGAMSVRSRPVRINALSRRRSRCIAAVPGEANIPLPQIEVFDPPPGPISLADPPSIRRCRSRRRRPRRSGERRTRPSRRGSRRDPTSCTSSAPAAISTNSTCAWPTRKPARSGRSSKSG